MPIFEGLLIDQPVTATIDPKSDMHPFLTASETRHDMVLRDGMTKTLDVAVQPAGEIAGRVVLKTTDEDGMETDRPLSLVPVEIINAKGTRIATTQTIYDGSFIASNVPFGQITVRLSPGYLSSSGLSIPISPNGHTVTLSADNIWIEDLLIPVARD